MRGSESMSARTCFVQRHEPKGGGVDGVADLYRSASAVMSNAMGWNATGSVGDKPLEGRGSAK